MAKGPTEVPYAAEGAELRRLRAAAGLYQHDIGAALGVTKQAVSEWERGIGRPELAKAKALGETLGAVDEVLRLYGYDGDRHLAERVDVLEQTIVRLIDVLGLTVDLEVAREVAEDRRRADPPAP